MRFDYILILSILAFHANSQDMIYKHSGEIILARVREIGIEDVKYNLFTDPEDPTYSIEKTLIVKIIFQNGHIESYLSSLKDPALYQGQARNAIKFNIFSPLTGYAQFGFERSLKPGSSIEFNLGIIGLGMNRDLKYKCFYCKTIDTLGL